MDGVHLMVFISGKWVDPHVAQHRHRCNSRVSAQLGSTFNVFHPPPTHVLLPVNSLHLVRPKKELKFQKIKFYIDFDNCFDFFPPEDGRARD